MNSKVKERSEMWLLKIKSHADQLLQYGVDPSRATPLLCNAIRAKDGTPVRLDLDHVKRGALLANTASQQTTLRMFSELSNVLQEPLYAKAAAIQFKHLFRHHTDRSGLLFWGGHTAYDLENGEICFAKDKSKVHELKFHYPAYELMWEADEKATRTYIEAFWNAHIIDWSNLDFNRHGPYHTPIGRLWEQAYTGGPVFFWGKGLTFSNTGSDLYFAAASLYKLSGDRRPLNWAKRLFRRYLETRHEGVGISGYQYSQSANSWCDGPRIRGDRAQYQIAPLVPKEHVAYESTIFKPRPVIQRIQLHIAEMLGEDGKEFLQGCVDELKAWGQHAYRERDNSFIPMLTDGYSLEGLMLDRNGYFGKRGFVFKPYPATSEFFWTYAYAYRLTGDTELREMTRKIARGLGLGELGPLGANPQWTGEATSKDHCIIQGLLELSRAENAEKHLAFAADVADDLVRNKYENGWFVSDQVNGVVLLNDPFPFTLLHLVEAIQGGS